jgi:hypothetical protein
VRGFIAGVAGLALVSVAGMATPGTAGAEASPVLSISRACPGFSTIITGKNFPAGTYTLQATAGSLNVTQVTAQAGLLQARLGLPANMPHNFSISVTAVSPGTTSIRLDTALSDPNLVPESGYPEENFEGDCYLPGETVDITDSATVTSPATVVADSRGRIAVTFRFRPARQPSEPNAFVVGRTSHQFGSPYFYPLSGTTLLAGQSIYDNTDPKELSSASDQYALFPGNGTLFLNGPPDQSTLWYVGSDPKLAQGSKLTLRTDGDLVYYSGAGKVLWSSGTASSGTNNQVVMQNDGNLVMFTSAGKPIWSREAGIIGAPNNLHTLGYASGSRPYVLSHVTVPPNGGHPVQPIRPIWAPGPAVYLNVLLKQAIWTGGLIRGAHRTVYLQRYVAGHWQNMLVRTTDSAGTVTVGFIQPHAFVYRMVAPRTATASAATSSPFIR